MRRRRIPLHTGSGPRVGRSRRRRGGLGGHPTHRPNISCQSVKYLTAHNIQGWGLPHHKPDRPMRRWGKPHPLIWNDLCQQVLFDLSFFFFEGGLGYGRLRRRISLIFVDWSDRVEPEPTGKRFVGSPAFTRRESDGPGRRSQRVGRRWLLSCPHHKAALCPFSRAFHRSAILHSPRLLRRKCRRQAAPTTGWTLHTASRLCGSRDSPAPHRTWSRGSIAQINPASSRTTAITACGSGLPRSVRCLYRRYSRNAARSARSIAHAGWFARRARTPCSLAAGGGNASRTPSAADAPDDCPSW